MTRFLRTADGGLVNADRIERIYRLKEGQLWQAIAILTDGPSLRLGDDFDEIQPALLPVIAATPGYVRLRYYEDSVVATVAWVSRTPIVAWRIAEDAALPVTPDQDEDDTLRAGVLLPDGQVVQPFLQTFADEESWRKEMDRQAKEPDLERSAMSALEAEIRAGASPNSRTVTKQTPVIASFSAELCYHKTRASSRQSLANDTLFRLPARK